MEPISFGLAIVAEARTLVFSIKNRIVNYRDGPAVFQTLSENIDCLAEHIAQVEHILGKFPTVVPNDISDVFNNTLSRVYGILQDSNTTMQQLFSKTFAAGSSSVMDRVRAKAIRTFRANALRRKMDDVESKIKDASNQLLQLTLSLGNALKMQEQFENLAVVETTEDKFSPRIIAPACTEIVKLDFCTKDAEGQPVTPEGKLKQSVLSCEVASTVTAATGVMKPAYGIVGMAGVGKTVALQGLAYDKDVRLRFPDGVLFMTLGQSATVQTVLRELAKLLAITGANKIAAAVGKCTVLRDAVDHATAWFEKRICLFLVDDMWPTIDCKTGFLADIRQLLRNSPDSRMAITTRSTRIAQFAGTIVNFGARDPLGSASMKIFMAHAASGMSAAATLKLSSKSRNSVLKILSICAGLPIALAVTGSAVAFLSSTYGDFESACESYATRLEKKKSLLGLEEGTVLKAGILLGLEYLEVEFLKWKTKHLQLLNYSISDLYTSLCVLDNQAWVPLSVLERLWKLHEDDLAMDIVNLFCGMSLATLQFRQASSESSKEVGVVLHDLQLYFCQQQAKDTKTSSRWHSEILTGYLESRNHPAEKSGTLLITNVIPRPWWSNAVPDDGYIHDNVCRHLSCSGQGVELAALLVDSRWTILRGRIGGILGLKSDFEILDEFMLRWKSCGEQEPLADDVREGFNQIFRAVQLSWGRMAKGLRVFHFNVYGRLVCLRKSNSIVDAYVKSVSRYSPKPCLLPVSSFVPALDSALIMEIPVDGPCRSVVSSPCGRYFAAGAGIDIAVANSVTGEILQVLMGHSDDVTCIAFCTGSKKIVSGSDDKTVMVWEWESSESPLQVLEGHDGSVSGVSVSGDGARIFSSSYDKTLRVWDTITGTQKCVLPQSSEVNCIAVCRESLRIAIGLDGGTMKVLDGNTMDVIFEDSEAHEENVLCTAFSPSGSCLATGSRTVLMWDTQTWTRRHEYTNDGEKHWVHCVGFKVDGKQIGSISSEGTIRLWDVENGNFVGICPAIDSDMCCISFIGDGDKIVSGSFESIVRIWDARPGTQPKEGPSGHSDWAYGVSISQDGLQVASASVDRTVRLWAADTGEQIGAPMAGHTYRVRCVSFSPDGRRVVSGSHDGTLRLWDTDTQTQIGNPFEGHTNWVQCVSFSNDGLRIVSGSWDRTIRIWNAATHKQIGEALQGHQDFVVIVSESADGYHIVSRDFYGCAIIWNRESRAILWKMKNNEFEYDSTGDETGSEKDETTSESSFENEITDDEAEEVIRNCGQLTPNLWPKTFPESTAELYCDGRFVYSSFFGEKTFFADLDTLDWRYHVERKLFAAGLKSGAVAICKLSTE